MILAALVVNVSLTLDQQPAKLEQRFLRKNDLHFLVVFNLIVSTRSVDSHQSKAVAIGRHEAHRLPTEHEQRAVEKIPRVLSSDCKLRFLDHLPQLRARQHRAASPAGLGQCGKVLARQCLHPRVETIGRNLDAVLVLLDSDVRFRQRLDDLVELLRRKRQRTALRNRCLTLAPECDLEIGRKHAHLITLCFEQHIRKNGNGVLAFDDALEKLQFSQKLILPDNEFHRRAVTSGRSDSSAGYGP